MVLQGNLIGYDVTRSYHRAIQLELCGDLQHTGSRNNFYVSVFRQQDLRSRSWMVHTDFTGLEICYSPTLITGRNSNTTRSITSHEDRQNITSWNRTAMETVVLEQRDI
ncbi:hypothetical protein AA0229_1864 [Gluconobacter cerinus NRIC 0229]|nr:hypothetical protein AA0229_1864 [Gluconobacter cerinus NRIC 0229]